MRTRWLLPLSGFLFVGFLTYACQQAPTSEAIVSLTEDGASVSPSGRNAEQHGVAMVRLANALPGSTGLEVLRDSTSLVTNVPFGGVSPYEEVSGSMTRFRLRHGGTTAIIAESEQRLQDGLRYTLVALPDRNGGTTMRVIRDDLVPGEGRARVRVIHAAPGLDDVAVAMTGASDPLFANVDYGGEAGFKDVAPTTAGFTVRRELGGPPVLALRSMGLAAGTAYTFILTSRPDGQLMAISFSDAGATVAQPN
ncbi:MAG: DUF4397 domain-containing protein [Gemmatimonadota bacterium]